MAGRGRVLLSAGIVAAGLLTYHYGAAVKRHAARPVNEVAVAGGIGPSESSTETSASATDTPETPAQSPKAMAIADRNAQVALAKSRCDAAAQALIAALRKAEGDVERFGDEWRHVQENLAQYAVHAPRSGMRIPYPRDVDFPRHGRDIRSAAMRFKLEVARAAVDVKSAWLRFLQDRHSGANNTPDSPLDLDSLASEALRSEPVVEALDADQNLNDRLQAINKKYQAIFKNP